MLGQFKALCVKESINLVREEIILIGPIGAGKSTVGKLLSERLKLPQCSMDEHRWAYYDEIGYNEERANEIRETEGFTGVYKYWKKFEIHAVERILQDHSSCVFDFGAGHSVYENETYLARAKAALHNFSFVILLLPSECPANSMRIINKRNGFEEGSVDELNYHFITHKSNTVLATHIVYTENQSVNDVVNEILSLIYSNSK